MVPALSIVKPQVLYGALLVDPAPVVLRMAPATRTVEPVFPQVLAAEPRRITRLLVKVAPTEESKETAT